MKVVIDNRTLETDAEISVLEAARRLGIEIPTLCYREGYDHYTSCMVCVVKDRKTGRTVPACSARIADGMEIETQSDDIRAFRKSTLELLLSEHVGDCEAPCQRLCALHTEIPQVIRDLRAGQMPAAVAVLRRDMALAGVLERFCNAPCEKGCRRGQVDEGVSIQHLMRHVADWHLQQAAPELPAQAAATGKRVAIVGAGTTGLATAYYLALAGHRSVVFESQPRVLDRLRNEKGTEALPDWVVDGELALLERMGVEIRLNTAIGPEPTEIPASGASAASDGGPGTPIPAVALSRVRREFDAVVLACGAVATETLVALGVPTTAKGIQVDADTARTGIEGVFAGGHLVRRDLSILKSVQQAKLMAACIGQCLDAQEIHGLIEQYNHTLGRLQEGELQVFAANADAIHRVEPAGGAVSGFAPDEALAEAGRCLHCDCRANHDCKLRRYSDEYGAVQGHFKGDERASFVQVNRQGRAIYEPGKCVKCGLCVRITRKHGERYGFTFVGRGFEVRAAVSLNKTLAEGLEKVADEVIDACPTGALAGDDGPSQGPASTAR